MSRHLIVMITVVLAATAPIYAQPIVGDPDAAAKLHYERGKQLTNAKDFAHAYDEFAAGYELTHRAPFLFNMGECQRVLGNAGRARELYHSYLVASPQGELAAAARTRMSELGGAPVVATQPPAPVVIPPPAVVAEHVMLTPPPQISVDRVPTSTPLWHRTPFWIGVGATLVAGSVAIYAVTRHSATTCQPPSCVSVQ